ncbi:MAG: hypothetical protein FJX76_05125 [Armatimonadetes bacterium]|nr:hypothetical protein [Armatimonadota bacterium]
MSPSSVSSFGHLDLARNLNKVGAALLIQVNRDQSSSPQQMVFNYEEAKEAGNAHGNAGTSAVGLTAGAACWASLFPMASATLLAIGLGSQVGFATNRVMKTKKVEAPTAENPVDSYHDEWTMSDDLILSWRPSLSANP